MQDAAILPVRTSPRRNFQPNGPRSCPGHLRALRSSVSPDRPVQPSANCKLGSRHDSVALSNAHSRLLTHILGYGCMARRLRHQGSWGPGARIPPGRMAAFRRTSEGRRAVRMYPPIRELPV